MFWPQVCVKPVLAISIILIIQAAVKKSGLQIKKSSISLLEYTYSVQLNTNTKRNPQIPRYPVIVSFPGFPLIPHKLLLKRVVLGKLVRSRLPYHALHHKTVATVDSIIVRFHSHHYQAKNAFRNKNFPYSSGTPAEIQDKALCNNS